MWAPEPVRSENGLAMKVAMAPCFRAVSPASILKKIKRSAVVRASAYLKLISYWALASSWSDW